MAGCRFSFNPSRGIAIIQTRDMEEQWTVGRTFQSLTRDSNHSNYIGTLSPAQAAGFNPSRGIAIIQTERSSGELFWRFWVSIPHAG